MLVLLLCAVRAHAAGEIECRSSGYRYNYCRVDTDNRVELVRRSSGSSCDYGRSWGYDNRGIWVDNGCAATFRYGRNGRGGSDAGKIVAGVAAVAILGAILNSHNRNDDRADKGNDGHRDDADGGGYGRVPGWAVGRFSGDDRQTGARVDVNVDSYGRIRGWYGRDDLDGQIDGDRAWLGNRSYGVVQTRDGFQLVEGGRGVVDFYRN
jgi:hypothetical protein